MFDFYDHHNYIIFTNGYNVVHVINANCGLQTTSGQTMCLFNNDKNTIINMFFQTYKEFPENENDPEDLSLYPIYESNPIMWSVGYDRQGATEIENLLAATDFVRVNALKHPNRNEYAIPFMQSVFDAIPNDLPEKAVLLQRATYKVLNGQRKTAEEMLQDGWIFN